MRTAGNGLLRALRALAHLYNRPEETEGRIPGAPIELSPLEYFDSLVSWWSALQQEDASEEDGS